MKKLFYIPVLILTVASLIVSCDSLLDVDSERYTFDEDYQMGSAHDSLYSLVGIISELQKLGDRYVLLGELRGELMQTNDDASLYLKQLNDFAITKDNPYASIKEYYSVINNCNYVIQYVDTTARDKADKPNHRVMAAAKSIRAWTYLQLVLNYGSANYITNPILSAKDVNKTYEVVDLTNLCDYLIEDLTPFKDVEPILMFRGMVLPINLLIGECHLWKASVLDGQGQASAAKQHYLAAASAYYELIKEEEYTIPKNTRSYWEWDTKTNLPTTSMYINWTNEFDPSFSTSAVGYLASSPDFGHPFTLDTLTYNRVLIPSEWAIKNWDNQLYFYSDFGITDGDLRYYGSYVNYGSMNDLGEIIRTPTIYKYIMMSSVEEQKIIMLYRYAQVYLHYAEAINRLGYSQMAYEAMKSGLNPITMAKSNIRAEVYDTTLKAIPNYLDFTQYIFTDNVGTKMRGLGNLNTDTTFYIIPKSVDSIQWVEDEIIAEYALECAFEGSRFHDLMRVAIRRNDPAFLADKVARKYTFNKEEIRSKLMDPANWYLPK